jgi:hypothetical protein
LSERRIRLPADVEMEDRLAFGLTARQLFILTSAAVACYATFSALSSVVPMPVAVALVVPLALLGIALALGRRDGLSGDRLAVAAARHLSVSKRKVAAPDGLPPRLSGVAGPPAASLLALPVRAILRSGVIELTDGSWCLLMGAAGTSWALRSEEEQAALVEAFGKWLNSIVEPAAITVRSETVNLDAHQAKIRDAAVALPNQALRHCAETYAGFLGKLAAEGEGLRRRQILLALTTTNRDRESAAATLQRRASEANTLLHTAGVELSPLSGEQAAALLPSALGCPDVPQGSRLDGVIRRC